MPQREASKRSGHCHYFWKLLAAVGTTGGTEIEDDIIKYGKT